MFQPCISNPPSLHCLPDEEIEDEYEEEYGEDAARIDIDLADLCEAVVALGLLLPQYSHQLSSDGRVADCRKKAAGGTNVYTNDPRQYKSQNFQEDQQGTTIIGKHK